MKSGRAILKLFMAASIVTSVLLFFSNGSPSSEPLSKKEQISQPANDSETSAGGEAYRQAMKEAEASRDEMLRIAWEIRIQNRQKDLMLSKVQLEDSIEFSPAIYLPPKPPPGFLDPDGLWHRQMKEAAAMLREQHMPRR